VREEMMRLRDKLLRRERERDERLADIERKMRESVWRNKQGLEGAQALLAVGDPPDGSLEQEDTEAADGPSDLDGLETWTEELKADIRDAARRIGIQRQWMEVAKQENEGKLSAGEFREWRLVHWSEFEEMKEMIKLTERSDGSDGEHEEEDRTRERE